MRIYSMTATFGKLEHETLNLQPGLNIIQAPNEWGKSTWCAFLIAMLYGIDTRAHSTKTTLADKERYAPWSGSPMSGRIDLCWQDRDITIERRTKGRNIFGDFRAYETETGIAVLDLTAANCGQQLLGVERSVFVRSGFLRLSDLPVTQDESLRRRLNALVTTGDESGAGDILAQKLKDLKNACRSNRSNGLLPQAEALREELETKLQELESLQNQSRQISSRQMELNENLARLENHKIALRYTAAQADASRVTDAEAVRDSAARHLTELESTCQAFPPQEQVERLLQEAAALQSALASTQSDDPPLPPQPPASAAPFQGMSGKDALSMAQKDASLYASLSKPRLKPFLLLFLAAVLIGIGLFFLLPDYRLLALIPLCLGLLSLGYGGRTVAQKNKEAQTYVAKYGSAETSLWLTMAQRHAQRQQEYMDALNGFQTAQDSRRQRIDALNAKISDFCKGQSLQDRQAQWREMLQCYHALAEAQKEYLRCDSHVQALQAMAKPALPPQFPDEMTESEEETARLLSSGAYEQQQIQLKLGQCLGRMEKLGQESSLRQQLESVNIRITKLEDTYAALTIAQQTLADAASELQRRFAPRITQQAQELFGQLTENRYDRLTLDQDLALHVGAKNEDTLRSALWRSDGTVDQLYLALRLAVAQALAPQAPLILDDVLVRFDDIRHAAAMDILRQQGQTKQIILFTCQSREQNP